MKLSDKLETIQQEKVNLCTETLQEVYTTNEDVSPILSKVTEENLFKFVNKLLHSRYVKQIAMN